MKTNLAFALEQTTQTPETVDAVAGETLDPVQLDQLLRLGSAQSGARPRTRAAHIRRKRVSMQDNHSGMFPAFRVR